MPLCCHSFPTPCTRRYLIYANVCRSLFERHKLLFSFLLTTRIMQGDGAIDPLEWRFLISGQSPRVGAAHKGSSPFCVGNVLRMQRVESLLVPVPPRSPPCIL